MVPVANPPLGVNALQTPQQFLQPPAAAPQLAPADVQGDVIIGLQKKWRRFASSSILADAAGFKAALRGPITRDVTSAERARQRENRLRDHKVAVAAGSVPPSGPLIPAIGLNVAFTRSGPAKLLPGVTLNLAKKGKVPAHLAVIAALMGEMADNRLDFRRGLSRIDVTPKKPREGGGAKGKFGRAKQRDVLGADRDGGEPP